MFVKVLNNNFTQSLVIALIVLGTIFCVFTPNYYLFKIGSRFAIEIMVGYLCLGFAFLFLGQQKLMFTSFICCAGLCVFLKYASNTAFHHPAQTSDEIISVAHFNLSTAGEDFQAMVQQIRDTDADLISIQELTPNWSSLLEQSLGKDYPYKSTIIRPDPYGLGVYSKYPLQSLDTFYYEDLPNIVGSIQPSHFPKELFFISSHTTPPLYSSAYEKMKGHLNKIGEYVNAIKAPIMTFGDYNAPPWWAEIQDLKEQTQSSDSRRSSSPGMIFQNPVDYIFYSKLVECV